MKYLNYAVLIYPASDPDNAPAVYHDIPLDPACLKEHLDDAVAMPVSEVKSACWKSLYLSVANNIDLTTVVVNVTLGSDEKVFTMEIPMDGTDFDEAIFGIQMEFMADLRKWMYSSALNSQEFRSLIVAEIVPSTTT